jgi:hypothetical protein
VIAADVGTALDAASWRDSARNIGCSSRPNELGAHFARQGRRGRFGEPAGRVGAQLGRWGGLTRFTAAAHEFRDGGIVAGGVGTLRPLILYWGLLAWSPRTQTSTLRCRSQPALYARR